MSNAVVRINKYVYSLVGCVNYFWYINSDRASEELRSFGVSFRGGGEVSASGRIGDAV